MRTVGIIGAGAIGGFLAKRISMMSHLRLVAMADLNPQKVMALNLVPKNSSISEVIDAAELVIEAASAAVVPQILSRCIAAKRDSLFLSSAGLLDHTELLRDAQTAGIRVLIPAGAVAGIDALRAAN